MRELNNFRSLHMSKEVILAANHPMKIYKFYANNISQKSQQYFQKLLVSFSNFNKAISAKFLSFILVSRLNILSSREKCYCWWAWWVFAWFLHNNLKELKKSKQNLIIWRTFLTSLLIKNSKLLELSNILKSNLNKLLKRKRSKNA